SGPPARSSGATWTGTPNTPTLWRTPHDQPALRPPGPGPGRPAVRRRLRRVPGHRRPLGTPAPVRDVRPRRLLRLVAEQARDRALPRHRPPARPVVRAGRELVGVLTGRKT